MYSAGEHPNDGVISLLDYVFNIIDVTGRKFLDPWGRTIRQGTKNARPPRVFQHSRLINLMWRLRIFFFFSVPFFGMTARASSTR